MEWHYNAVQHKMIFHTSLHWLTSNINKSLESQKKLHTSSSQASYGMSIVRNLEKINHVLMALYCIQVMPSPGHYNCSRERLLLSQYSPILVCSVIKSSRIFVSMFASFIATIWKKTRHRMASFHYFITWKYFRNNRPFVWASIDVMSCKCFLN